MKAQAQHPKSDSRSSLTQDRELLIPPRLAEGSVILEGCFGVGGSLSS